MCNIVLLHSDFRSSRFSGICSMIWLTEIKNEVLRFCGLAERTGHRMTGPREDVLEATRRQGWVRGRRVCVLRTSIRWNN
jgi:hypothetical protein